MRKTSLCLLMILCFCGLQPAFAIAVAPSATTVNPELKPPLVKKPLRKAQLAVKVYKILKAVKKGKADTAQKPVLGTLSLICGALGLVLLFTVGGFGLLFSLVAIILGIIAPKKRGQKGRTEAIIGLVLGSATLFLLLLAVAAFASAWN